MKSFFFATAENFSCPAMSRDTQGNNDKYKVKCFYCQPKIKVITVFE